MKTYCKNLHITETLVAEAYENWGRGASGRKNVHRVTQEHGSPENLIREITEEIQGRHLRFRPIRHYWHVEPSNGKRRRIGVHSVKQQVADYVAITALETLLAAKIGFYQVSSVKGKGQLFAARTVRRWVEQNRGGYHAHLDVKQCYPSTSHEAVMRILRKYVRSPDVLYVAETILKTYDQGLDIGSYFSLRVAQLVLSFGYHHVEGLAKERRGKRVRLINHQLWYMDDIILISRDKRNLRTGIRSLQRYLRKELGLTLKPWKISRISDQEPVDIAGYTIRPGRTTIRASIFLRARRAFRRFKKRSTLRAARQATAYWGWLVHANTRRFIHRHHVATLMRQARTLISTHERRGRADHPHALSHPA